ncbi:MAG: cell envelope integrity protein TolA [Gammaproteobacteria bacterium]|nr:cell envelope integrity protein TolA [Gammaproteobacteria bacterium]
MVRNGARKPIGRTRAAIYAVLVHAVVIGLLLLSFRWRSDNSALRAPEMIQAHVVDETAARQAAQKLKEEELAQQKLKQQQQAQQELEQQKLEQQEALREQQLRQQQEAQLRQQQEAQLRQQQEAQLRAAIAAKLRAAAREQARQAALRKQQALQAAARRKQRAIASLQRQLAAEQQHRAAAAAAAAAAVKAHSTIARYVSLIQQKVKLYWLPPLDARKGMKCLVRVNLVPGGDVIQASVVQSSGDPVFDRSVVNAVYRASPLPLPADNALFPQFQDLQFEFNPEH